MPVMEREPSDPTEHGRKDVDDSCAIASALLYHDRRLLPWLFLLAGAPSAIEAVVPEMPRLMFLLGLVVERLAQLAIMFGVAVRWRRRLEQQHARAPIEWRAFGRLCSFGFGLWFLCVVPLLAATAQPESPLLFPATLLFVVGIAWSLRYYFYFVAVALLGLGLTASAAAARSLTRRSPRAAVSSAIAPLGATFLLVSLCAMPYPDGRSLLWASAGAFFEATFWVLATYTGLAFALPLIDDREWRSAGLDPYRSDRIQTLRVQGKGQLADLLTPKRGCQALFLAALLFVSNSVRDFNQPPAAALALQGIAFGDNSIRVTVEASDPEYHLRGFLPLWFSVATSAGTPISSELVSAKEAEPAGVGDQEARQQRDRTVVTLEFRSAKTKEALEGQQDVWLWYEGTPMLPLKAAGAG